MKVLLIGLTSLLLCSCAATIIGAGVGTGVAVGTDNRATGTIFDDQSLSSKAKDIANAIDSKGSYTFSSYNGKILLAGQVPNQYDKDSIYNAVQKMNNINGVWDYLSVEKNQSIGQISTDTYLTSAAKSRLIAQKDVNTNNIKVVTCNGVVYLMGHDAGNKTEIDAAIDGIKSIDGVKNVIDLID